MAHTEIVNGVIIVKYVLDLNLIDLVEDLVTGLLRTGKALRF